MLSLQIKITLKILKQLLKKKLHIFKHQIQPLFFESVIFFMLYDFYYYEKTTY